MHHRFGRQHRKRGAAVRHIRHAIPMAQNILRLLQIGVLARIDRHELRDQMRDVGARTVGEIEFVFAERRRRDRAVRAEYSPARDRRGWSCWSGCPCVGEKSGGFRSSSGAGRLERRVVGIEHEARFRIPQSAALCRTADSRARSGRNGRPAACASSRCRPCARETGRYRRSRYCPSRRRRCS